MGLDIFDKKKTKQIQELQSELSSISFEKNALESDITSLKSQYQVKCIQNKQLNSANDDLTGRVKVLENEKKQKDIKILSLLKELENQKQTISDLEKKSLALSLYEKRFGSIQINNDANTECIVSDYDKDKSFFDVLTKKKGNPFSNEQVKAIRYECEKHMRLIAGAGSGKTETICAKAAYLTIMKNIDESRICMITFTRKAANEMQTRVNQFLDVDKSNIMIGTFHSVFIKLFNMLIKQYPYISNYGIQGDDPEEGEKQYKRILSQLISKYNLFSFNKHNEKTINERISYWINTGYTTCDMVNNIEKHFDDTLNEKSSTNQRLSEKFSEMMNEFESIRKEKNIAIFDDYLLNLFNVLNENSEARCYLQDKFDYIFIDEFQDTNQLQVNILNLLCPPAGSTKTKLIIVGDDDQSIYMFRGSDPIYIKNFDSIYPTKTFELMKNYRSKSEIVYAANRLIASNNHDRILKSMSTFHNNDGDAYIVELPDIYEEANWIIDQVEKLGETTPFEYKSKSKVIKTEIPNYTSSVVLYRSVSQLQGMMRTLDMRGIPYVIENKDDLLGIFNITEFKYVFDTWKQLIEATDAKQDYLCWRNILLNIASNYYIKSDTADKMMSLSTTSTLDDLLEKFKNLISQNVKNFNKVDTIEPYVQLLMNLKQGKDNKITELLNNLFEFPKIKNTLSKDDLDYIRKECETYNSWDKIIAYYGRLEQKKKEMKQKLEQYSQKKYNALYLLTIHKSKGLAFENVFVIGCYDSGIPSSRAVSINTINIEECKQKAEPPTTIEEERRLMYVAVTRARKNLYVTFPSSLQGKPCGRSQFLGELRLPFSVVK